MALDNRWVRILGVTFVKVYVIATLTFALIRFMPGGPVDFIRARLMREGATEQEVDSLVAIYTNIQPDKPLYIQYFDWMIALAQGDLGQSLFYSQSVSKILAEALPWTVFLMATSLVITFGIGIALGAIIAYREGSRLDSGVTVFVVLLNGVPYYVAGLAFVYILAYQMQIFPTGGYMGQGVTPGLNLEFITSVLYHGALPIISIILTEFGGWTLSMRGNSIQILGEDYLRVARLRGLSSERISLMYVGKNAILPMYTGLMISIGFLFGGSVILERIFSYPGVGWYLVRAIDARDYSLMMGGFIIITFAVIVGILIADLTYSFIDPRIARGDHSG